MREPTTFIKLDRNILQWRWYTDTNTFKVFMHLLLKANIEDHDFKKDTIHRGEVATSMANLAAETGLTVKQVKNALAHLVDTGEVTKRAIKGQGGYTIISMVSWDRYQPQRAIKGPLKGQKGANKGPRLKNIRNKEGGEVTGAVAPATPQPARRSSKYEGLETLLAEIKDEEAAE